MIIVSTKHLEENIRDYMELAKNGENIFIQDEESEIMLVRKDKIKSLKR